ncbi:MAG: NAD kinase [Opitutia bacterium UBA7350]|nr:MAG: NAD kinase [Opitutae bacterium UBA7350]
MNPLQSIAFVVNSSKLGAGDVSRYLAGIADCEGVRTQCFDAYPLATDALKGFDLCITIGGDGTLLGVLNAALQAKCAVLGVNLGKLGFLATFSQSEVAHALPAFIKGEYQIVQRSVLCGTNPKGETFHALNDIVFKETQGSGLVRLRVSADENYVSEYHCDGLIFSTPTGSTAYNLSAGGPIVDPKVSAIAMTPICPHTFGNRSVIFSDDTRILIERGQTGPSPRITLDGYNHFDETSDSLPLEIHLARQRLRLMQNPDHSHFAIVRDKLNWGAPAIREPLI